MKIAKLVFWVVLLTTCTAAVADQSNWIADRQGDVTTKELLDEAAEKNDFVRAMQARREQVRLDKFSLFTGCKKLSISIEYLSVDAIEIGLNQDQLRIAIESRLRSARLYDAKSTYHLYVNAHVVSRAFHIEVRFLKTLLDPLTGITGLTTTWSTNSTGTHGKDPQYIRHSVAEHIDKFLLEYLKVNEEACSG